MKKIILLSFILFGFVKVNAQTTVSKSSIGITLGPSFPIGYFGSKDGFKSGGLAKVGGFLAIDYVYKFSPHFGLVLSGQGSRYDIDKDALSISGVPKEISESASFNAGVWRTGAIMAGIFHAVPLTKTGRFNFELKILGGFQRTSSPDVSTTVMVMGTQLQQKSIASNSFAYLVGLGIRHHLTKKLSLKFNADYYGSNSEFKGGAYIAPTITDMRRDIEAINVGVGLGVNF